jgi:TIR domain
LNAKLDELVRLEPVVWQDNTDFRPSIPKDIVVGILPEYVRCDLPGPMGWSARATNAWQDITFNAALYAERYIPIPDLMLYYRTVDHLPTPAGFASQYDEVGRFVRGWVQTSSYPIVPPIQEQSMAGNPPPDFSADLIKGMFARIERRLVQEYHASTEGRAEQPWLPRTPRKFEYMSIQYCDIGTFGPREPAPPTPRSVLEEAFFSAFAPVVVKPGSRFKIEIWSCLKGQFDEVVALATGNGYMRFSGRKGPVRIELQTALTISLDMPDFALENASDHLLWTGEPANASFLVRAPAQIHAGVHYGTAKIAAGDVPLALLHFQLEVGQLDGPVRVLESRDQPVRKVFASYASENRIEVLEWKRGAETFGVEVYVDVLRLREGAAWEQELWRTIPSKDLFCLFWSRPSSESDWVGKEWRCALAARGLNYIHPVPLADPRDVPPPKELSSLNFNDPTRIVIDYEKARVDVMHSSENGSDATPRTERDGASS